MDGHCKKKKEIECLVCNKRFSWQRSLKDHMETIHNQPQQRKRKVECPICLYLVSTRKHLFKHLTNAHDVNIECVKYGFQNMNDFTTWKNGVEKELSSQFVLGRGTSILKDNSRKFYYQCCRSGTNKYGQRIKTLKNTRTRKSKEGGSVKLGKHCPASMDVHHTKDGVSVSFWKTHLGHDENFANNTLGVIGQNVLAGEEAIEVTVDNGPLDTDSDLFGDHFPHGGNIEIFNEVEENSDEGSMSVWINSIDGLKEHTPVLYYKESNEECNEKLGKEDMCLVLMTNFQKHICEQFGKNNICIDSICCENHYDFDLITLFIIDEFGDGCPVAYCVSNQIDETVLKIFFTTVKGKMGNIVPSVLMSNNQYHKLWTSVMSSPKNHLYCSWHVLEDWKKNLNKITNENKKIIVLNKLQNLLNEPSMEDFDIVLDSFTSQLLNDVETGEFGRYFELNYAYCYTQWALCFRTEFGIDTHEGLENFRINLKQIFEESKKFIFKKTLQTLCELTNDKIFDRLVKISENQPTTKTMRIKSGHFKSLKILQSRIKKRGNNRWEITNKTSGSCSVELLSNLKCSNKCIYKCDLCQACLHMFTCTCFDFLVRCNMCPHIHACATKMINKSDDEGGEMTEINENLKLSIKNKLKEIANICDDNDLSQEVLRKIMRQLDQAINIPKQVHKNTDSNNTDRSDKENPTEDINIKEENRMEELFELDSWENNEVIVTEDNTQDFDHSYTLY